MMNIQIQGKVLLLSCSTGEGHNACAGAIASYLAEHGVESKIVEGTAFVSQWYAAFLAKGHSLMYRRGPALFQIGWGYCERHPGLFERRSLIFKQLAAGVERLYRAVTEGGYDTVLCTHALPAVMLTEMLRRHPMELKTAFVATDYTSYPCLHMTELDHYLIPEDGLVEVYIRLGIPAERLLIGGIPLRRGFFEPMDKPAAKAILGLDPGKRHLLVMGGSMGCGPMSRVVRRMARAMPQDVEMTVICGNNRSLYKRMTRRYRDTAGVHIVGYCDRVPLYMMASDVYLTKPGGISVSEAATVGLPMVLVNAVAGCETYNLDRFLRVGGAVTAKGSQALAAQCLFLLAHDEVRRHMETALRHTCPPDGAAVLGNALFSASFDCAMC